MAISLFSQVEKLPPRIRLGMAVLGLLAMLLILDRGGSYIRERELENVAVKSKLSDLLILQTESGMEQRRQEAESHWASYSSLLLQDSTEGLNIAGLQSSIISTLSQCGLEQLVANVEAGPVDADPDWHEYSVAIRARDSDNVFPVCMNELAQLDIGLIVSDLTWRRGGVMQFVVKAYSETPNGSQG